MKKQTRAQAEIVGITIVMVLIMLGIIFAIRFVIVPDGQNIKQNYDRNQMAANFMDAMLKTTTECHGLTFTDLVQACAQARENPTAFTYRCPEVTGICDEQCDTCTFLNKSLEILIDDSLYLMPQYSYDFFICRFDTVSNRCFDTDILSTFQKGGCLGRSRDFDSKQQPIPTEVGNRVVQMYIC